MKETAVRGGRLWSDIMNGRRISDHDITNIISFLGATNDDDLVHTTWFGSPPVKPDDETLVEERLILVGNDGAGRTLRRSGFDTSADNLIDNLDSIYLCQTSKDTVPRARFCLIDIKLGDDLNSNHECGLVCRRSDFELVYRALRMGGRGGVVWRGDSVVDETPFTNLNPASYLFPTGLIDRILSDTTLFLQGDIASRLRDWDVPAKRGILLHGAPGNGKTVLTRICAKHALEVGMNVIIIEGVGRSSRSFDRYVSGIGDQLRRGASRGQSLLIFEDIDLHCRRRREIQPEGSAGTPDDRTLVEILDFLDGVEPTDGYVLLATTNYMDRLDQALIRPGRIDLTVEIKPPMVDQRIAALHSMIERGPKPTPEVSAIADLLDGASFADLAEVARRYKILSATRGGDSSSWLLVAAEELAEERGLLVKTTSAPADGNY